MNTLVVGSAGSGKTTNFLFGDVIQSCNNGCNVIAFCRTKEFPEQLGKFLTGNGYTLCFVDCFSDKTTESIEQIKKQKKYMIFVDVNTDNLNEIFNLIFDGSRFEVPTIAIFDEFCNMQKIQYLYPALSMPRALNVNFTLLVQSVTQLDKYYGDDHITFESILANMEEAIFLDSIWFGDEKYLHIFFGKTGASNLLMNEYKKRTGEKHIWLRGTRYNFSEVVIEPWENGFVEWITAKE